MDILDLDQDGNVDLEEFKLCMSISIPNMSESEMITHFENLDEDGSGLLTQEEVDAFKEKLQHTEELDRIKSAVVSTHEIEDLKDGNKIGFSIIFSGFMMAFMNGIFPLAFYFNKESDGSYAFNVVNLLTICSLFTALFFAIKGWKEKPFSAFTKKLIFRMLAARIWYAFEQVFKVLAYEQLEIVEVNYALAYGGIIYLSFIALARQKALPEKVDALILFVISMVITVYIIILFNDPETANSKNMVGMLLVSACVFCASVGDFIGAKLLSKELATLQPNTKQVLCNTIDVACRFVLIPIVSGIKTNTVQDSDLIPFYGWTWKTIMVVPICAIYLACSNIVLEQSAGLKTNFNYLGQFMGLIASYPLFGGFQPVTFILTFTLLVCAYTYKENYDRYSEQKLMLKLWKSRRKVEEDIALKNPILFQKLLKFRKKRKELFHSESSTIELEEHQQSEIELENQDTFVLENQV